MGVLCGLDMRRGAAAVEIRVRLSACLLSSQALVVSHHNISWKYRVLVSLTAPYSMEWVLNVIGLKKLLEFLYAAIISL